MMEHARSGSSKLRAKQRKDEALFDKEEYSARSLAGTVISMVIRKMGDTVNSRIQPTSGV
jgi:hypothetical protein